MEKIIKHKVKGLCTILVIFPQAFTFLSTEGRTVPNKTRF